MQRSYIDENYDNGVVRSWDRVGKHLPHGVPRFYWKMVSHDPLLVRQFYMMREGRHSLINMIRGAHGLPNKY